MSGIRIPRPKLLREDDLARIHEAALRILETVGIQVREEEVMEAAARLGLRRAGDRVLFDRNLVNAFVDEFRAAPAPEQEPEPDSGILLSTCQYAVAFHDMETDRIAPFTAERLVEAAKFLYTLRPYGVIAKTPGVAMDLPPALQSVHKQMVQALYCDYPRPVEFTDAASAPYLLDMAEAMGNPVTTGDVYVVSPLSIGGESFACALQQKHRLKSLWVSNMSSLGATAPIRLGDALAVGAAEVVGAAILAREATGLPVDWSVRVTPFDPRSMSITLGGPEEHPLQWACDELNAWYHNRPVGPPWGSLHTQAKLPDQQAAAEHLTCLLTGAFFGARVFTGIGRMSLDEVFSPEQAVIDLELRDHVQRLLAHPDVGCDPEACLAEARAGAEGGFLGLDSTVERYQQVYWRPRLFWRGMLGEWQAAQSPDLRLRAKQMVREQLARYDFEPPAEVRREVERIYRRAEQDLSA